MIADEGEWTFGGWGEIRTHGTLASPPVFKTGALNHSATHPASRIRYLIALRTARAEEAAKRGLPQGNPRSLDCQAGLSGADLTEARSAT
jgi:hypothetical protein